MEVNVKYRKDVGDLLDDPTLYQCLAGSLIYLITTHLDISYVVHLVTQFISSRQHRHLATVCYLRESHVCGLFFLRAHFFSWLPTVMLIGLGVRILIYLLWVGVCF